jgi:hypothetical protein
MFGALIMKFRCAPRWISQVLVILLGLIAFTASAATATWTNSDGGLWWVSTNWLDDLLPASTNVTFITNAGNKIVTIDAATPANNLSVQALTLRGPSGFTNTLQLLDVPTNQPLVIRTAYTNGAGGALVVSNSVIDATTATRFFVDAGTVTLESGLIDCTTTPMRVGRTGVGGLLIKTGSVLADEIIVGDTASSQGTLTLDGGNANVTFIFTVGAQVNSTGSVSIADAQLAGGDPGVTNKVGSSGFGQMTIGPGGTVTFPSLSVGEGGPGNGIVNVNGGQLNVTDTITKFGNAGFGQLFLNGGSVNIGTPIILGDNFGATGIVSVANGTFTGTDMTQTEIGHFGTGELNITGGTVKLLSSLIIADSLGSAGAVKVTGGELVVTNNITSIGRFGLGIMTVSNASVMLTNASVGRHEGANGFLTIQNNGTVFQHDDLSIGRFTNAVGTVFVNGGLFALPDDTLWVGREGIGYLIVSNGIVEARNIWVAVSTVTPDPISGLPVTNTPAGTATFAGGTTLVVSNFIVGTAPFSTGQVSVVDGNLVVTNSSNTGIVSVENGTFALNSGAITADKFFATNAAGQFVFNGGTVQTESLIVSNGMPFVIGDGVHPATLDLQGGVYSFADGLVISSNAIVTGCGTIVGNITNNGTLATNCGPVTTITIISITKTGDVTTVSFTSLNGSNHILEYKDALTDPMWSTIVPGVTGTGGVMSLSDTNALATSRFYRVHAQ